MKRILLVCLGNICRSPAAEGLLRKLTTETHLPVYIDSAGTGPWHVGKAPDQRMQAATKRRNVNISQLCARQVELADFYEFDYLLAMDLANQSDLFAAAPANRSADVRLFLDFASGTTREVPDPYYGGDSGFEHVLDLLEDAAQGFLAHLENEDG